MCLVPIRVLRPCFSGIGIDVALGGPVVELRAIGSRAVMRRDVSTGLGRVTTNVDYRGVAATVAAAFGDCGKGKSQQAARQQDAEFAHELFPRG